jgi:hypothetical protein
MDGQYMESQAKLVVIDSPRKQETETESTVGTGAEQMRIAADIVLREKSIDLAIALVKSGLEGHIQCARFLYDLAERYGASVQKQAEPSGPSLADQWAAEPEWTASGNQNTEETSAAVREQQV